MSNQIWRIKDLGVDVPYEATMQLMRDFTQARTESTQDEIWMLEHEPVFTLGQAGKSEHVLAPGDIPVVQSDRGGQVTYHGPGQLVVYLMLDLRRLQRGIREVVVSIEQAVIRLLAERGVEAIGDRKAPGVYVSGKKVAALGLRVKKGCTYHGLSLNVDMDLEPFLRINPCGYQGLEVIDMASLNIANSMDEIKTALQGHLQELFRYHGSHREAD